MITAYLFFWLIVALLFLLMEIGHPGLFFFLSFFFASLGAAKASFFDVAFIGQLVVFVIGFAAFALLTIFIKKFHRHKASTNVYALEGQKAVVVTAIEPGNPGQVKVNGQVWMAKSAHNETVPVGVTVSVVMVRGAHLVVQKIV